MMIALLGLLMTDLFKSKKEQLLDFIRAKNYVRTSDVIKWGSLNYCNGAERHARTLAKEGKIIRLTQQEKVFRFGKTREDIWEIKERR